MRYKKEVCALGLILVLVISIIGIAVKLAFKYGGDIDFNFNNFLDTEVEVINYDDSVFEYTLNQVYDDINYYAYCDPSGKWGFVNKELEVVIEPKYNYALDFSEGLAVVADEEGYKFIDKDENKVINCNNNYPYSFCNGVAILDSYDNEGNYIIIDYYGKTIGEFQANYISENFNEGRAIIEDNGEYFIISKSGDRINKEGYDYCSIFENGLSIVSDNKGEFVVDKNCNNIIGEYFDYVEKVIDGYILVGDGRVYKSNGEELNLPGDVYVTDIYDIGMVYSDDSYLTGVMDYKGNIICEPKYSYIDLLLNDYGIATEIYDEDEMILSIFDKNFNEIGRIEDTELQPYSGENGYFVIGNYDLGEYAVINKEGKIIMNSNNELEITHNYILEVSYSEDYVSNINVYTMEGDFLVNIDLDLVYVEEKDGMIFIYGSEGSTTVLKEGSINKIEARKVQ